MTKNEKIGWSIIIASTFTIVDVLHRKIGGMLSGGKYSSSPSWKEMIGFLPEFIGLFFIVLIGALIYHFIIKNEKEFICPRCLKPFTVNRPSTPKCPDCNIEAEILQGFYDRHPELKESLNNKTYRDRDAHR